MASVFSIESINLNGDILTASNGSLYINNNLVKNTSGIQLSDRFFIKGYSPISFYSKWPQQGDYLNETYLNDFFMATGMLVTCTQPSTGTQTFFGGFYERPASSVINTTIFANFELQPKQIIQHTSLSYKIERDRIIGLNIYNAPEDMRSISIHLLGYFPAAAHFDRMPKQISFYSKNIPIYSNGIHEEYSQWDSSYTGYGVYCSNSGIDKLTYIQPITGYISGTVDINPLYILSKSLTKPPCNPCEIDTNFSSWSGYYLNGNKFNFPTGYNFSGFSGENGFDAVSGFEYSGFKLISSNVLSGGVYSGYNQQKFGSGEMMQTIGWMSGAFQETISGFVSGYKDQYGVFKRLSDISGWPTIDQNIFKLQSGTSGFILGSSGYFIKGETYYFPSGNLFSGFSGQPNVDIGLGFTYSGIEYDISNGFFSGFQYDGFGYTGQWISKIGYRNISGRQDITGFVKANSIYDFKILSGLPANSSGISGYFFENKIYNFPSGEFDNTYYKFPKFDNNPNFVKYGNSYSGFFVYDSGFSGIGITDIEKEYIIGFISGYKDAFENFYQFIGITGSSGFITGNQKSFFPTGVYFSGFSGFNGFDASLGFLYTGFGPNPYTNSNFIGDNFINSGSGIISGIIGWRNKTFIRKDCGTGIMTGIIGSRNAPYSGILTGNFYHKDKFGNKTIGPKFGLNTGELYNESFEIGFKVPWNNRVGIDIYNPLSGISDINVVMFGYYE